MKKGTAHILILFILFSACSRKENTKAPTDYYKKNLMLIDEYHRICMKEKGKKYLYIPKEDVNSIIKSSYNKESVPQNEIRIKDVVFFFDSIGNVEYQANISKLENNKIYVECLNLTTFQKYQTELCTDSIVDLKKHYPYKIVFYR
jgi:hypothetical protein